MTRDVEKLAKSLFSLSFALKNLHSIWNFDEKICSSFFHECENGMKLLFFSSKFQLYLNYIFLKFCNIFVSFKFFRSWTCRLCFGCCEERIWILRLSPRISTNSFSWWWNWIRNGNFTHFKNSWRISRQNHEHLLCSPLTKGKQFFFSFVYKNLDIHTY